jgi:exonuclease III
LNTDAQSHATHDIEKKIKNLGYEFFHNSKTSSRGVGILIKKDIFKTQINKIVDNKCNLLLLKVKLSHGTCVLGSMYGPNENDLAFFEDLEIGIQNLNCNSIILGGDWNCTWDPRPVEQNFDVINMVNIPSRQRSERLIRMANILNLTDPYRILHPIKREFTYVPNARVNLNRSRIDFFLISTNIASRLIDCGIEQSLSSTSFDHKKFSFRWGSKAKKSIVMQLILK